MGERKTLEGRPWEEKDLGEGETFFGKKVLPLPNPLPLPKTSKKEIHRLSMDSLF